jgi:hypothetical protein
MVQPASEQRPSTTSDGNTALPAAEIGGTHVHVDQRNLPRDRNRCISVLHHRRSRLVSRQRGREATHSWGRQLVMIAALGAQRPDGRAGPLAIAAT